jgi:hypothetical protein
MPKCVEDWLSRAGPWRGGQLLCCLLVRGSECHHNYSKTDAGTPSLLYFRLAVLATLLVIGGIKMNPGPGNCDTVSGVQWGISPIKLYLSAMSHTTRAISVLVEL